VAHLLSIFYASLVTLALQNTAMVIIMHYSRVSVSSNNQVYSAASAVLLVEVLKCGISFAIAFMRTKPPPTVGRGYDFLPASPTSPMDTRSPYLLQPNLQSGNYQLRLQSLISEIGSADAWKLSIPALLYVLQNNLQYIAVSNLDVPTFQVTNQMKILTTAGFSVLLLHRKLSKRKWASLALLAVGVGIVQIQTSIASQETSPTVLPSSNVYSQDGDTVDPALPSASTLRPLTGFLAVSAACFTSGLAGVYFEMVLKGWSDISK
jgi:UDP-sugar transporter A1/2/3